MKQGERIEIAPAYEMSTRRQSHFDEVSGKRGAIVDLGAMDDNALIELDDGREVWINVGRLMHLVRIEPRGPICGACGQRLGFTGALLAWVPACTNMQCTAFLREVGCVS